MVLLWLRDELFDHGIVHGLHRHHKRVSTNDMNDVVSALHKRNSSTIMCVVWVCGLACAWHTRDDVACIQLGHGHLQVLRLG